MSENCRHDEDLIIFKLLKSPELNVGFYVDVGAWDPYVDSVTKIFYDLGWSGINIEPQQRFYQKLINLRPRDINLNLACSNIEGTLTLYEQGGLTTAVHRFSNSSPAFNIPMTTLSSICDQYVKQPIDFLKVDVEGYEYEVLQGMNWVKFRPKVLCIECTEPNTTIPCYEEWDKYLQELNYTFVEDNVYNRFYIDAK